MKLRHFTVYMAVTAAAGALAGCSSSSNPSSSAGTAAGTLTVPGVSSAVTYSFDLGVYDPATKKYYVTDRTNKAVDVVDGNTGNTVSQFKPAGLFGCGGAMVPYPTGPTIQNVAIPTCSNTAAGVFPSFTVNNDQSGPDGIDVVGNTLFVGDINKLLVLNKATGAIIAGGTIAIPSVPTGLRADEGCFDPINHLYAISTPAAGNPFMTILDTTATEATGVAPTIIATLIMNDSTGAASAGLEACVFDTQGTAPSNKLFVNNDGSTANPNGELDGIPAANLVALKVGAPHTGAGAVVFAGPGNSMGAAGTVLPLPALCDPTGVALGPNPEIGAMCRPGTIGQRMDFVILNKNTGANIATVATAGGGDQITYDSASGNWFLATSRMTASGNSCGAGSTGCVLSPAVTIVNGASHSITAKIPSGNNSHSVATGNGLVFSPFTNGPSATAGGVGFPNGGIALFTTQ